MSRLSSGEYSGMKRKPETEKMPAGGEEITIKDWGGCVMSFWNYFKNPKTTLESNKPPNNGLVLFRITRIEYLNY